MNIKPETIELWDWSNIQAELCARMSISEEHFRAYHKIVGGEYKDFWHVCLDYVIPDSMRNDVIVSMFRSDYELTDLSEENSWKFLVVDAWNSFYDEVSPNDDGIYVRFSW